MHHSEETILNMKQNMKNLIIAVSLLVQMVLDKLIQREKRLIERKRDTEILNEIRKAQEDSEIAHQKELPELDRIPGLKLAGQALADMLMIYEFLHNFGDTLGFGKRARMNKTNQIDEMIVSVALY